MPKKLLVILALVAAILLVLNGCESTPKAVAIDAAKLKMFQPLPASMASDKNPANDAKITLGRMLYYEPRLSKNHDVSCNTCHLLDKYGVDLEPTSTGHKRQKGGRNAPTVFNAAAHFAQFWDGRAADVEEQAKGPMTNPIEMAMPSEKNVLAVLTSMPEYVDLFKKAFPDDKNAVSFDNAAKAIAAFERGLTTPARWDKFLQGDQTALTDAEKAGFNKYMEAGCQACHMGALLGGSIYQKLGAVEPWEDTKDLGRFAVTKQEADKMMFKVPSLRNIEKTGPYFHDGSIATLEQAVKEMGTHQLGKQLTDADVASIVTWLKSLTGEVNQDYVRQPELPKSTPKTPKPNPA